MTTTPLPPNKEGATQCIVRWQVETAAGWLGAYNKDAFEAYATQARADLEVENANLKRNAEMHEVIRAGDSVLLNEQAALLRECRLALDDLLAKKPMLAALVCGSTSLGNLRASMYAYRPAGVFGGEPALENTK